jgi:hypothetical protein
MMETGLCLYAPAGKSPDERVKYGNAHAGLDIIKILILVLQGKC